MRWRVVLVVVVVAFEETLDSIEKRRGFFSIFCFVLLYSSSSSCNHSFACATNSIHIAPCLIETCWTHCDHNYHKKQQQQQQQQKYYFQKANQQHTKAYKITTKQTTYDVVRSLSNHLLSSKLSDFVLFLLIFLLLLLNFL